MQTLNALHVETALLAAEPLATEHAITEAHRAHAADPVERELAVLAIQFPAQFQPIEDEDLLAGRVRYPLVSFGPEPAGLGYSCLAADIRRVLEERIHDPAASARAAALLEYWRERTTSARTRAAYPPDVAAALPSDAWTADPLPAFPLYRMAGTVLDYARLLREGLGGLRADAHARAASAADADARRFHEGTARAHQLVSDTLARYADQARALAADCPDAARAAELRRIAASCAAVVHAPPATCHAAMQLAWVYALCSGTWNYGRVDVWLGDFLARDLDAGLLDEGAAVELFRSWWRLMKAYDNQYNNRVFLGGVGRPNPRAADRLALVALEATRRARLNQPQLSLRLHREQDPALLDKALTVLGEGCTFPILYNDDVNVPAVMRAFGVPREEAEQYTPYGCGEYVLAHRSVGTPNGVINLPKCLDLALRDGVEPLSGRRIGPRTGDPAAFRTFGDLWSAYTAQVEHFTAALAVQERIEYDVAGADAPFLLLSALYDDCPARGRGIFSGGVRHLGGTIETYGNTNTADALAAIDAVVFRSGAATLPGLVAALDADFAGAEDLHARLLAAPKYGNDDDTADAMAVRVHEHVCRHAAAQAARAGLSSYLVVIINNWANVIFGKVTGASADGRRAGQPFANGNNPSPGSDRRGVTAFLNSLVKLDPALHAGSVQNMKFAPALFRGDRPKLEALLRAYFDAGGSQAMITVVSRADLEAALREPARWGHLMVRVGGFSIRFIDLPRDAQLEVLARTCHE